MSESWRMTDGRGTLYAVGYEPVLAARPGMMSRPLLTIGVTAWREMEQTVLRLPPESGGVLGGTGCRITRFFFDRCANVTKATYEPSAELLTGVLQQWQREGIGFMGLLHSHRAFGQRLSRADIQYARAVLMQNRQLHHVDMLLCFPGNDLPMKGFRVTRTRTRPLGVQTPTNANLLRDG